ncbi:hypothetical protein Acr_27g0003020 [Actinidia rufa]|uniref:Uncharacterized protein n=1 Tax=Actinidia rufa TaxID=165716 RepID=A0A7J0H635_9ERIC|nr:hypothetical protein Acr_27g0003020 [Actinidia rufa]
MVALASSVEIAWRGSVLIVRLVLPRSRGFGDIKFGVLNAMGLRRMNCLVAGNAHGVTDPPKNCESAPQKRDGNAPQSGQRRVPNRDGSVPLATVRTLMLQIWDFARRCRDLLCEICLPSPLSHKSESPSHVRSTRRSCSSDLLVVAASHLRAIARRSRVNAIDNGSPLRSSPLPPLPL